MVKAPPSVSKRLGPDTGVLNHDTYTGNFTTHFSNLENINEYPNVRWWERLVGRKNINNIDTPD